MNAISSLGYDPSDLCLFRQGLERDQIDTSGLFDPTLGERFQEGCSVIAQQDNPDDPTVVVRITKILPKASWHHIRWEVNCALGGFNVVDEHSTHLALGTLEDGTRVLYYRSHYFEVDESIDSLVDDYYGLAAHFQRLEGALESNF